MNKWLQASGAAMALLLAGVAPAQPAGANVEERIRAQFVSADENKDGVIEVDEIVGHAVYVFVRHDANKDGFLVPDELPRHDPARFKLADRNGDGRLSMGEVAGDKVVEFFEIDTNRDGVITIQEVLVYEASQRAKRK